MRTPFDAKRHHALRTSGGRFFTLVELLIIIAIIGVLAALLMPALRSALASAHTTSCANNLRILGAAMATSAEDKRGWYPGGREWQPLTTWAQAWFYNKYFNAQAPIQEEYVDGKWRVKLSERWRITPTPQGQLYHCPAASFRWEDYPSGWSQWDYILSYARTYQLLSVRVNRLKKPSQAAVLIETWSVWDDAFIDCAAANANTNITDRHNRGNLLFYDGHVQRYQLAEFKRDFGLFFTQ